MPDYTHLYSVVRHLNRAYFPQPQNIRITTPHLRDPAIQEKYIVSGWIYIRRLDYDYHHIMREPTDGCNVELTREKEIDSILLDSAEARRLIQRRSYF
jgi:hypothetical protein